MSNRCLALGAAASIGASIDARAKQAQVMNDTIFSFGELGFQEFATSAYLTKLLEDNGFTVERGISGIPTAWMASWGSGKPVIALGSYIDGIPKASQKPGVAEELLATKAYFVRDGYFKGVDAVLVKRHRRKRKTRHEAGRRFPAIKRVYIEAQLDLASTAS